MRLADRWGRPLVEVLDMTMSEYELWVAYFEIEESNRGST